MRPRIGPSALCPLQGLRLFEEVGASGNDVHTQLEYLFPCSEASVESYLLSRQNETANLQKAVVGLLSDCASAQRDVRIGRWVLSRGDGRVLDMGFSPSARADPVGPLRKLFCRGVNDQRGEHFPFAGLPRKRGSASERGSIIVGTLSAITTKRARVIDMSRHHSPTKRDRDEVAGKQALLFDAVESSQGNNGGCDTAAADSCRYSAPKGRPMPFPLIQERAPARVPEPRAEVVEFPGLCLQQGAFRTERTIFAERDESNPGAGMTLSQRRLSWRFVSALKCGTLGKLDWEAHSGWMPGNLGVRLPSVSGVVPPSR
jgi:hypothetical protein